VWDRLHQTLLDELGKADQIDWGRACLDSASVPAKKVGATTGPKPTDRGKPGTKHHVITDRRGTPLATRITGANRHDSAVFEELVDAVRPIRMPTRAMTIPIAARHSPGATSRSASPVRASSRRRSWAGTGGWWGARWRGCASSGG
jgi:hypothetical protein